MLTKETFIADYAARLPIAYPDWAGNPEKLARFMNGVRHTLGLPAAGRNVWNHE